MYIFLAILLVAAMLATVAALIRGIVVFLQTTEADLKGEGPSASAVKSNKAMQFRIFFHALAIMIVVLILFMTGRT